MASADAAAPAAGWLRIEVVCSAAGGVTQRVPLKLPAGSTLADAVAASGLATGPFGGSDAAVGIWGRVMPRDTLLRERDRVELYRPLTVDPKQARRLRYQAAAPTRAR